MTTTLANITVPLRSDHSVAIPVGCRVKIERNPYDEPMPIEGTIIGVRVERRRFIDVGQGPFSVVVVVEPSSGGHRELDIEEIFIEPLP